VLVMVWMLSFGRIHGLEILPCVYGIDRNLASVPKPIEVVKY